MSKAHRSDLPRSLHPGALALGIERRGWEGNPDSRLVFRCRKNGLDFLGQATFLNDDPPLQIEMFNAAYFDQFTEPRDRILAALEFRLLQALEKSGQLSDGARVRVRDLLEKRSGTSRRREGNPEADPAGPPDLLEIFDRLNREYFDGGIRARVEWGRDNGTRNRHSFHFGTYDDSRKLIRIHPRLTQDFVPRPVLELTVYHEMCHQRFPPIRKNGRSRWHHPEFKKKEREYRFYQEARLWEKENWRKLMMPAKKNKR